jgi:hypothetical protein
MLMPFSQPFLPPFYRLFLLFYFCFFGSFYRRSLSQLLTFGTEMADKVNIVLGDLRRRNSELKALLWQSTTSCTDDDKDCYDRDTTLPLTRCSLT